MNTSRPIERVEAVVVGAGPIGIETAIELRERGIDAHVVEAGPIGHTISWWAPQTRWFSSNDRIAIAGVPLNTVDQSKASREEYLNYLRTVVDQFSVPISTFERVENIEPVLDVASSARWQLSTTRHGLPFRTIMAKAVILAVGGTDFPNQLKVPGDTLPHVDGYLREIHRYHGRHVLIIGGRNSAVEAAIRLHRGGAKVSLSYHGESLPTDGIKYWLRPEIEGLIHSGAIQARFGTRVVEIHPSEAVLEIIKPEKGPERVVVKSDDVLALIGYRQDQTLFEKLSILSDDEDAKPIFDPATMQTPRPGIYLAGTAVGGTQSSKYQVFLENCHDHPIKIADDLCGPREGTDLDASVNQRTRPQSNELVDESLDRRIALQPES
jgi:thioredoxin reductase (NADPH)